MVARLKCSICTADFIPKHSGQRTCLDTVCKAEEKKQKARIRERKEKLKTKRDLLAEVQKVFNQFIRMRDGEVCISCGKRGNGQFHAGHFRTTKSAPQLRYNEDNCHSQCASCNTYLSGNLIAYRQSLVKKIGVERVEYLECSNEIKRWTTEELKELKAYYKAKIKELK